MAASYSHVFIVPRFLRAVFSLLFGRGLLRQFADDRQYIRLIVTGLYHHEDRNHEDGGLKQRVDGEKMARCGTYDRTHNPVHNQPGREEIQPLEGVESDHPVVFETARGENDYGSDPADGGNIAEDGRGAGR